MFSLEHILDTVATVSVSTRSCSLTLPSPSLRREGEGKRVAAVLVRAARSWLARRKWTLVIALAAVALHWLPMVDVSWLALSREALAQGRWWTPLTGALLHVSDVHVCMDVLGLLLVGCIFEPRFGKAWPWLIAFTNIVVGVGVLALYRHLPGYCGLSALDQGLLAAGAVALIFEGNRRAASIIGVTLIAKWMFEILGGLPLMGAATDDPLQYGQPVPWAHAIGGIAGALAAAAPKCLYGYSLCRQRVREAAVHPLVNPRTTSLSTGRSQSAETAGPFHPAPSAAWYADAR
jgi:rhomboid family GlyGly-CTERM serine protease